MVTKEQLARVAKLTPEEREMYKPHCFDHWTRPVLSPERRAHIISVVEGTFTVRLKRLFRNIIRSLRNF